MLDRRVLRDVQRERGLSHRWTSGDDDEIRRLKARRHLVEIVEAARHAGDRLAAAWSASMRSIVGHKSSLIRVKPSFVCCWLTAKIFDSASSSSSRRRRAALERLGDDRRRHLDQPAENRFLAHDLRVILDVRRGRHGVDEKADVVLAARRVELTATTELLGERQRIDDTAALRDQHHRAENPPVTLGVKHRVVDVLDRAEHRFLVDQHRGNHRLLGVLGVRRAPVAVWITRQGWRYRVFGGRAGHLPRWGASNSDCGGVRPDDT